MGKTTMPSSIVAIDIGSNSFHMVVARKEHGEVRILDRLGEKVQLGAGLDAKGNLDEASQQRALECLARFQQRIRDHDAASVQVVATNALRAAKNRKAFIKRAQKVIDFPIEVISGNEEARLIYLGVSHTLSDDGGKRLVIDIGGGSTEIIIGERFEALALESLHMGCVSYRDRFFSKGVIDRASFDKAITRASKELLLIQQRYQRLGWNSCVGSSGSIKAVMQALVGMGYEDGQLTKARLEELKEYVIELGDTSKLAPLGIKKERLSIFPAGLAILYACIDSLQIQMMEYTEGALREGLLYDIIGRIQHEDVRERSIRAMQRRYTVDREQALRVQKTVLHALDQVAGTWGLEGQENVMLLRWASEVFEVGLAVSHSQYHKHGAYLLQHSDMAGFTRPVQAKLAAIVRAHRRKLSMDVLAEFDDHEAKKLLRLCILFRLAVVLSSARKSAETEFSLSVKGKGLNLCMGTRWLKKHPLTQSSLEDEQAYLERIGFVLELD